MNLDASRGRQQHPERRTSTALTLQPGLVRQPRLGHVAGGYQQDGRKGRVVTPAGARVAVAVVGGQLGGKLPWPLGPAVELEEEAEP
jgi:hypothetical protein